MKITPAFILVSFLVQSCLSPAEAATPIPDRYGVDIAVLGQFEPFSAAAIYSEPSLTSQQVGSLPAGGSAPFTSKLTSGETTWLCVQWNLAFGAASWKCTGWVMASSGGQDLGTIERNVFDTPVPIRQSS